MASLKERVAAHREGVQRLRGEETTAVDQVQAARRAYERHKHSPEKHAVQAAEKHLADVRAHLTHSELEYEKVLQQWHDADPLDRREDYWRDRVQDLSREEERQVKTVQRLRREEKRDRDAAVEETHAHDGTVDAHETLVFTRRNLTDAEARLVLVRGLRHHAEAQLAIVRKEQQQAKGGGDREKVVRCALDSVDHQAPRYSQAGSWSLTYFPGGEPSGVRSDCSQWFTKIYFHAGLPDPNGQGYAGGYTGTLGAHGHAIDRSELKPGDPVLYGSYPHHHVEMYVGTGEDLSKELRAELARRGFDHNSTIGHGSPPVDEGTVDLLSGPKSFRTYL